MDAVRRESSRVSSKSSTTGPDRASSRPSILYKAYNSVNQRGSRASSRLNKVTSTSSADGAQAGGSTELKSFSGVFARPEPEARIVPAPTLTQEQEKKYQAMLEYFSQQKDFPVNLQVESTQREPASDWEKLRLLSRESLLRYLRATRWDVAAAKKRLIETIAWRREFGVDNLDPDEMAKEAKSGKETVLGYDKRSRPLHYMHPHRNDTKESPRQMQFAVWILERCIDLMPPGIEQLALLINFDNKSRNPTSIANAKLMLYILQNHYVERLGIALCINVPWVFKLFWNAIQPFIDPVTKSKCKFDEAIKDEVPTSQLSAEFGGDLDATYNHDTYWPDLVKLSAERRKAMLRRFQEDCHSEVGASEWVIRGGDDVTSPLRAKGGAALSETATSTSKSSEMGPSSDPQAGERAREDAVAKSDERADGAQEAPSYDGSGTPLQQFKTPVDTLNAAPLEREFSVGDSATGAGEVGATDAEGASSANASHQAVPSEQAAEGKDVQRGPVSEKLHHLEEEVTKGISELNHKLQGVTHALHRDSRTRKSGETARPSEDRPTEADFQPKPVMPSATEMAALAGTAGVSGAAGAIGASLVENTSAEQVVNVFFFAAAKEATGGVGSQKISLPEIPFPLSKLAAHLVQTVARSGQGDTGSLEKVMQHSKWSVNEDMVADEEIDSIILKGGEDVAIIPPVSGG